MRDDRRNPSAPGLMPGVARDHAGRSPRTSRRANRERELAPDTAHAPGWSPPCTALVPWLCSASCTLADAFIRAVARSVLLQAQQAEQPAIIVNDGQPAPPLPQEHRSRGTERVRRPRGAADERAELRNACGPRYDGEVRPLDSCDQPSVCSDDQSHVEVVVPEKSLDGL